MKPNLVITHYSILFQLLIVHVLSRVGMTVSEGTLQAMVARYGDKSGNVRFDDFVACFIKLKSMQSMS